MSDCIFCKIAAGQAPAKILHQDEHVVAFRDVRPAAPTHVLVIPREHIADIGDIKQQHGPLLGRIFEVANRIARDEGIVESGYRILVNHGPDAGQTVYHLHFHLLGGKPLPPLG